MGKPVLIGPAFHDFTHIVETLRAADGITVVTRDTLAPILIEWLHDPAKRHVVAANARQAIRAAQGASQRHADILLALLQRPSGPI